MATVTIPLHNGKYPGMVAIVDEQDAELVKAYNWFPAKRKHGFYAAATIAGDKHPQTILMHRLIMGFPDGEVDHANGDKLDNRRANLRTATTAQNQANRCLDRKNTSVYRGVSWSEGRKKWVAYIDIDGKRRPLGRFDDPVSAALAFDEMARKHRGEFARLNFPNPGERAAR